MGPARPTGATARRARGRASRPRALLSNRRPFLTKTSAGLVEGRALLPPRSALLAAKVRRFRDLAVALAGVGGALAVETGVHIHAARVHAVGHAARGAESWVLVGGVDAATEGASGSVVAAGLFDRSRHVAVTQVQVRAADAASGDLDDHIRRCLELGVGNGVDAHVAAAVPAGGGSVVRERRSDAGRR
jgi:hypothetical protein